MQSTKRGVTMYMRKSGRLVLASAACAITVLAWSATNAADTPPVGPPQPAHASDPAQSAPAAAKTEAASNAPEASATHAGPPPATANLSPDEKNWAMIGKYCGDCHNAEDWAGGVAFDTMTLEGIPTEGEVWEHAVRKLRGRLMPPAGKPQPSQEEIKSFVSWMESNLDKAAETHTDPGRVVLHRLNRKEYSNAVRDLLKVNIDINGILPQDDVSDGFDNIANVLQVSPSFLDQYLAAARAVSIQALGDATVKPVGTQYVVKNPVSQQKHVDGLPMGTRGGMLVEHEFPADGEYELNIANMALALWVYNMEFEHTLIATLDGKKFFETKIGGEEDMKSIDQKQDPAVDAINKRLKGIRFKTTAGPHKVAVTFLQRTFAESEDRLQPQIPGGGQDRVLRLSSFEIKGPFNPTGVAKTPSRQAIFVCEPKTAAEQDPCARQIIATLAHKAYRRPVKEAELEPLLRFYRDGKEHAGFDEGIRRSLTAILANPYFLYRSEPAPLQVKAGETFRITDLELASRLSFFLWSSVPDSELLQLAAEGKLHESTVLKAQVRRMLSDKRAETLASNFAFQWLHLGKLSELNPDPNVFPYAGDPRDDFRTELRLFINSVFKENRNVTELLTADYTFLNEQLALHYGINTVKGDRFRRVKLEDSKRWGLLGKGAVLMVSSYPNRTAPVLRGAWILENITGTPPAPPPPNVEALKENEVGKKVLTVRELMAEHSKNPTCHSCHGVMDPLGFALENFDGVGRWREKDRFAGTPIDSSGVLPDGTTVNGPDDLRKALNANSEQFVQTLTEKLMTYALGRTVEYRDMPTVRAIVRKSAADSYKFDSIVMGIIESAPFQMRRLPTDEKFDTQQVNNVRP